MFGCNGWSGLAIRVGVLVKPEMIALFVVISAIVPVKINLDKDYLMDSLWVEEIPELGILPDTS